MIYKNNKRQYWQEFKYWLVQLLLKDVTRVEMIFNGNEFVETKRFVKHGEIEFSCQDDFRTLKIFVK